MLERDNNTTQDKTRELQRKLYLAAKSKRNRRFHALYDRIFRPDILLRAWKEVKANDGSAGIDDVSIEDVERLGVENFLWELADDLKERKYRPWPVRRVYIPKPDGRMRPLGIPTVRDRVVQQACKIVIEPLFEANFCECSYGFRPKRNARQAIQEVRKQLFKAEWVVEVDIRSYFDCIDHELLLKLVERRISDRRVLKLIRRWLKSGILESGTWQASETGSPQGGVISPLLANIYLHVLDMYWTTRFSYLGKLIRYADDFVIVCATQRQAEQALTMVKRIMRRLKLAVHEGKTKIVDMGKAGFEFLGFHVRKCRSPKSEKLYPYYWPSQKRMKAVRAKIRELTCRRWSHLPMPDIVKRLNPVIIGWRNYFKVGNSTRQLQQLDWYVWLRLWMFEKRTRGRPGRSGVWFKTFYPRIPKLGIAYFYGMYMGPARRPQAEGCR